MGLPNNKVLKEFIQPIIIECGTEHGNGIAQFLTFDEVKAIYSIEIDYKMFGEASTRFFSYEKVKLYFGDSRTILPFILPKEPALIWLDSHSLDHSVESPLMDELEIIKKSGFSKYTILIDDFGYIGKGWGKNLKIENITDSLVKINPDYIIFNKKCPYEGHPHKISNILVAKL